MIREMNEVLILAGPRERSAGLAGRGWALMATTPHSQ